jgi:hypothetical protein
MPISSLNVVAELVNHNKDLCGLLLSRINTVLLWCDEIEQSLCTIVEFVQIAAIRRLIRILDAVFIKYSEQECSVMKSAVFDCIIEFRYLTKKYRNV